MGVLCYVVLLHAPPGVSPPPPRCLRRWSADEPVYAYRTGMSQAEMDMLLHNTKGVRELLVGGGGHNHAGPSTHS